MRTEVVSYNRMYAELEQYEKNGVCILIDGNNASPMQVVRAHMLKENGSYMRDYEMNDDGYLKSLSFININKRRNDSVQQQSPFTDKLKTQDEEKKEKDKLS